MASTPSDSAVANQLAIFYHRNGYLRWPSAERRQATPRKYKKGYEVRLVGNSFAEVQLLRRLLRAAGFKPGEPFVKGTQWRLPIYGRKAVMEFLMLVGAPLPTPLPQTRRGKGKKTLDQKAKRAAEVNPAARPPTRSAGVPTARTPPRRGRR